MPCVSTRQNVDTPCSPSPSFPEQTQTWRSAMKIVVAYKWAPNPQDASVGVDGIVDWSRAKSGISEYDPVAIELARRLADATGGEVIGLTAGPTRVDASLARKAALSRGFDRAVIVADDALEGAGTTELAAVLAAAVRHIGEVDLVIAGDSSVDVGARMVPAVLAGQLGWPARTAGTILAPTSTEESPAMTRSTSPM